MVKYYMEILNLFLAGVEINVLLNKFSLKFIGYSELFLTSF